MDNKQNPTMSQSPPPSMLSRFSTALVGTAAAKNSAVALARATLFMVSLALLILFVNPSTAIAQQSEGTTRLVSVTNKCDFPVWMVSQPNNNVPPLRGGTVKLSKGESHDYSIPKDGWAGVFWPKTGCNDNGRNCTAGDAVPPCPPSGCQPPADSKIEFNFPNLSSTATAYYDISLVDGYTLPFQIQPRGGNESGSCTTTKCNLSLNDCPQNETQGLGNLRVSRNGKVVQCLSPCEKWTSAPPYGLGKPKKQETGLSMCCPTPPVKSEQCRRGPVVQTKFVQTVHQACPTAYSYAYDDQAGSHDCSTRKSFNVTLCP